MSSYAAFRADSVRIESSSCATRYCSDIFYKAWRIRDTLGRRGGGAAFRRAVACRNMAAVGRAHRCVMLLWVMALGNARRWVSGQRGRAKYPGVTFRVSSGVHRARAHVRVESTPRRPSLFSTRPGFKPPLASHPRCHSSLRPSPIQFAQFADVQECPRARRDRRNRFAACRALARSS